jgi:hypothetical protein
VRARVSFEAKWEPRDLWVGAFFDRRGDGWHLYVCPLPTLLLHWRVCR